MIHALLKQEFILTATNATEQSLWVALCAKKYTCVLLCIPLCVHLYIISAFVFSFISPPNVAVGHVG